MISRDTSNSTSRISKLRRLEKLSKRRGSDSAGMAIGNSSNLVITRGEKLDDHNFKIARDAFSTADTFAIGFSRMKTNGEDEDQPSVRENSLIFHNGIVTNVSEIEERYNFSNLGLLDSNCIAELFNLLALENTPDEIANLVLRECHGQLACIAILPQIGKLVVFSNNGSMYYGCNSGNIYFASEKIWLEKIGCNEIKKVMDPIVFDVIVVRDKTVYRQIENKLNNVLFHANSNHKLEALVKHTEFTPIRCQKCVLPSTFPYIVFDENGICNYCSSHSIRMLSNHDDEVLFQNTIVGRQKTDKSPIIVPFSGGRDSSYTLIKCHQVFGQRVVAFTYDWGFVTDVARRNISNLIGELGIEHILVSANLRKKRDNVRKNLEAWLKNPHLGLLSLLTSGDKFFFKYSDVIMKELDACVQVWGTNSLETTHFKSGFLGIEPNLDAGIPYLRGLGKQLEYHRKRFKAMSCSKDYFNSSLFDTLLGEYYRSIKSRDSYMHFFDYFKWDELALIKTITGLGWKTDPLLNYSWRVGDATAPFYNYVYREIAGFTEHDTFRSNQIREGLIDRRTALQLLETENLPNFLGLKWYLDAVGIDFAYAIEVVNKIPKLYESIR